MEGLVDTLSATQSALGTAADDVAAVDDVDAAVDAVDAVERGAVAGEKACESTAGAVAAAVARPRAGDALAVAEATAALALAEGAALEVVAHESSVERRAAAAPPRLAEALRNALGRVTSSVTFDVVVAAAPPEVLAIVLPVLEAARRTAQARANVEAAVDEAEAVPPSDALDGLVRAAEEGIDVVADRAANAS